MERLPLAKRILLGPGPSDVAEPILRAMASPIVGHLDPQFLALMDEVRRMLRLVWRTEHESTFAIPGTGTSGMEACLVNLLEPGERILIGVSGYFGARLVEVATRVGAEVTTVEAPWGEPISEPRMLEEIARVRPSVVAFVHAETSTGVCQPVPRIARAAHEAGALVVVDCVTSLGGIPVEVDAWSIDAAYSCTQKCLGAPPGLAPVTFSPRALEKMRSRRTKPRSFYLDVALLESYWNTERAYHHTAPISLHYALHAALRAVLAEGLDTRFERHRRNHEALVTGLHALGLELLPAPAHGLVTLHAVRVPAGVDEAAVRKELLVEHAVEIGAGLGPLRGKIWRIGLMGSSSTSNNVLLLLAALEKALRRSAAPPVTGGVDAALESFRRSGAAT